MTTKAAGEESAVVSRFAAGVEYNGARYCGWQRQKHCIGVQEHVERALSQVANQSIGIFCAGRTDTGVHASGQVIHFDPVVERSPRSWRLGANSNLPDDIAITWVLPVNQGFHARFSAVGRTYRYTIINRETRLALQAGSAVWVRQSLDVQRMQDAAKALVGTHDFSSFRAQGCQAKSPVRIMRRVDITQHGNEIVIEVEANAFLHHMVRNIAGVLIAIGRGDREIAWVSELLLAKDRTKAGVTAPPTGLCLERVEYPDEFGIDEQWRASAYTG